MTFPNPDYKLLKKFDKALFNYLWGSKLRQIKKKQSFKTTIKGSKNDRLQGSYVSSKFNVHKNTSFLT